MPDGGAPRSPRLPRPPIAPSLRLLAKPRAKLVGTEFCGAVVQEQAIGLTNRARWRCSCRACGNSFYLDTVQIRYFQKHGGVPCPACRAKTPRKPRTVVPQTTVKTKTCSACNFPKPITEFYLVRRDRGERQSRCIPCSKLRRTRYHEGPSILEPAPKKPAHVLCRGCFGLPHRRPESGCSTCGLPYAPEDSDG